MKDFLNFSGNYCVLHFEMQIQPFIFTFPIKHSLNDKKNTLCQIMKSRVLPLCSMQNFKEFCTILELSDHIRVMSELRLKGICDKGLAC